MRPAAVRTLRKLSGSPYLNRAALAGRTAIEQMADDLRVLTASTSSITAEDLELAGWTQAQIAKHGTAARRRAIALAAG